MHTRTIPIITLVISVLFGGTPTALVFAYEAAPVAITRAATFVTEKSVRLNGQANPNGMPDAYSWFEWGLSGQSGKIYETPKTALSLWYGGNTLIDTNAEIIGLAPGTQYFFRQIVESGRGKDIGQTVYVTTKLRSSDQLELVIVETNTPTRVTSDSVMMRGYVSPHGDANTEAWFEWGTSQRFEASTNRVRVAQNSASFEQEITRLQSGTAYYFRIAAENASGRAYGATRMVMTTGTPPPPLESERAQQVSTQQSGGDTTPRVTTQSGTQIGRSNVSPDAGTFNNSGDTQYGFPGVSSAYRPGDIFGALFGRKDTTNTDPSTVSGTPSGGSGATSQGQLASVEGSGALGQLWDALFGDDEVSTDSVLLTVVPTGTENAGGHTPVEYVVHYEYQLPAPAGEAYVRLVLPDTLVYIGDTTANELLLERGTSGERMYILPIGTLRKGDSRTFSLLSMTTAKAKDFPYVRGELVYTTPTGVVVVSGASEATEDTLANQGGVAREDEGSSIFPSSFFGWILYVLLIVLIILGARRLREFYLKRKEALEAQEAQARTLPKIFVDELPVPN
jgi:hypothetical protein